MSLQQINQMIADVDKDGSGAIDFDEFVHMMTAKIGERDTKEELSKAFRIIDHDNNVSVWHLSLSEFIVADDLLYFHSFCFREKFRLVTSSE